MNKTTKTIGKCRKCNAIIESRQIYSVCGAIAVDGTKIVEMSDDKETPKGKTHGK